MIYGNEKTVAIEDELDRPYFRHRRIHPGRADLHRDESGNLQRNHVRRVHVAPADLTG